MSSSQGILLGQRSSRAHLMSLRSRLGKAAVIGGRAYVERFATSDEFAAIFMYGLDPAGRKTAIEMVVRIAERSRRKPPAVRPPSREERVKIRWTDDFVALLRAEAPQTKDDIELAKRLGLPPYCRGAMRAARSRYGLLRGSQKGDPRPPPRTSVRQGDRPSRGLT